MSESREFSALLNDQSQGGEVDNRESGLGLLSESELILPAQFFSRRAGNRAALEPLRRLAGAVLADAVHCFLQNFGARQPTRRRLFAEAEAWLLGKTEGPFSLENVCYLTNTNYVWLRRALRGWQQTRDLRRDDYDDSVVAGGDEAVSSTEHALEPDLRSQHGMGKAAVGPRQTAAGESGLCRNRANQRASLSLSRVRWAIRISAR